MLDFNRQIKSQLHNPDKRRASRLLQDVSARDPLLVGIIGCGRLGSHLAHCLLSFAEVNPEDIKIATRRPETLSRLNMVYKFTVSCCCCCCCCYYLCCFLLLLLLVNHLYE